MVVLSACTGDRRAAEVQGSNRRFGFREWSNSNISVGFRFGDLLDRTLNPWLGSGSNPVLKVREPDRSQSIHSYSSDKSRTRNSTMSTSENHQLLHQNGGQGSNTLPVHWKVGQGVGEHSKSLQVGIVAFVVGQVTPVLGG